MKPVNKTIKLMFPIIQYTKGNNCPIFDDFNMTETRPR